MEMLFNQYKDYEIVVGDGVDYNNIVKCGYRRPTSKSLYVPQHMTEKRISLMGGICLIGSYLNPLVVSHYKTIDKQIFEKYGYNNVIFAYHDNAFFTSSTFKMYLELVLVPHVIEKRKLYGKKRAYVIVDGFKAHFSEEISRILEVHDIVFLVIPANTLYITQPLDFVLLQLSRIDLSIWRRKMRLKGLITW